MEEATESAGATPAIEVGLSSAQLRAQAPLLRLEAVRPGDVLLTFKLELAHKAIAGATHGGYAHAALFLLATTFEGCPPRLELVEADNLGVGPTFLNGLLLRRGDAAPELAMSFAGCDRLLLLRHPQMASIAEDRLLAASERLRASEFYRPYSPHERLVEASAAAPALRHLARLLFRLRDRRKTIDAGAFCSELVAMFFRDLGLPLFHSEVEPHTVSPGRLVAPDSRLVPASGQPVLWPDDLGLDAQATKWLDPLADNLARPKALTRQVAQRESLKRVELAVGAFWEQSNHASMEQLRQSQARSVVLAEDILKRATSRGPDAPSVVRASSQRLVARAEALRRLEHEAALLDAGGLDVRQVQRFPLREFIGGLQRDLTYQGVRRQALIMLHTLRRSKRRARRRRLGRQITVFRRDHFEMSKFFAAHNWPRTPEACVAKVEAAAREDVAAVFRRVEAATGRDWPSAGTRPT